MTADPALLALLVLAGAVGGVLVGLIGVGGGIVYAPALLIVLAAGGVTNPALTPLVLGTSLLCVGVASASGAASQYRRGAVHVRAALVSGAVASVAVMAVGRLVATQPWYDSRAFAGVFASVLLLVAAQMVRPRSAAASAAADETEAGRAEPRADTPRLVGAGLLAGALSALAGVGGGTVLVPVFNGPIRLPLRTAIGTSAAAIVLVAASGVVTYAVLGWGAPGRPAGALGYVSLVHAAALVLPAIVTARWGVALVHRVPVARVRVGFAVFAAAMAVRLLWEALGPA